MFILKKQITAWWPVKVAVPDDKTAGRFIEHKFEVEFTLLDRDQAKARDDARSLILDGKGDAKDIIEEVNDFDDQTYVDLISDWRGVLDEDKAEVPFSRDMLVLALKQPLVRQAITKSYEEMASGEIRRKN